MNHAALSLPLSVLDLCPVASDVSPSRSIHESVVLRSAPRSSATTGSGSPSITTCRRSPRRRPRSSSRTWPARPRASGWGRGHHAAESHAAEGRRDLPHARVAVPWANRSRSGARARNRSGHLPCAILALSVVCGEDDAHAQRLARPGKIAFARAATGERGPLPTVEEAARMPVSAAERAAEADMLAGAIVGGPDTVRDAIRRALAEHGADEIMIATLVPDHAERIRSYEGIAALFS